MQSVVIKLKRKIRWSTATFFFFSGIISATWASRIPEIQHKFQLSDAQWGGVLFALPMGLVSGIPLSSWLIEKFTSSRMMTVGGIIFSSLLCGLALAPNVYSLILILYLFGLSRNLSTISINTNAIEVQRVFDKPIVASFHGVWSLACLFAAAIGTFMISRSLSPTLHFCIISILTVSVIIFNKRDGSIKKNETDEKKPFFIKPDKYLLILGLMCFCTMMCEATIFDWAVNYFKKVIHADNHLVTVGYTAFIVAMTSGRFIGDKIIDFMGLEKVLFICGVLMATGFIITVLFPTLWIAAFGFLLIGLGDSIVVPSLFSLAGKSTRMKPGYAIASVSMIGYAGFLLGPLIVGFLSQHFGLGSAFTLMAVLSFFISLLSVAIMKFQTANQLVAEV
jgi:MFS family permease